MEKKSNNGEWEKMKKEINELMMEGRDYAHQLGSASSQETREHLAKKILESYKKSLTIMNYSGELVQDSPHSHGGGSPKSDDSDQEPRITKSCKKSMPRWTQKVRITLGSGIDKTLDDGFSWRKYGQKDILGAKYPRGYYRCTYRKSQGCEATKQVQRSDDNHMFFDISYRGVHSCSQASNVGSTIPAQNLEPNQTKEHETIEIPKESLDIDQHQNYFHYPFSSDPNLTIENFGSTSFSSDLGNNVSYNFPASHDGGSASHSVSNSPSTLPSESPFGSFDPFGRFGGFYS